MLRIKRAAKADASALYRLNEEFNGEGLNTIANIEDSIENNSREVVCVAYFGDIAAGFCCAQIQKSMCYAIDSAEITELYVTERFRRKGIAAALMLYLERALAEDFGVREFTLLTGEDNSAARALYESLGYSPTGEAHLSKIIS